MRDRELRIVTIYMLMFGLCMFGLGRIIGVEQQMSKYNDLKNEYFKLENEYNILEAKNDYDVNNDGVVNAVDYALIKNYIMNQ